MRAKSKRIIIELLEEKIASFPDTTKGYNRSRSYRIALKEFKRNESNRNRPK